MLPNHPEIIAAGARAGIVVDPGRLDAAHYAAIAAWDRSTDVELWRLYVAAYFEAAGVPAAQLDAALPTLVAAFRATIWSRPIAAGIAALGALAQVGVPIGIVSNADGRVEPLLRDLGVCQVGAGPGVQVGIVVDSTVVGYEKPDPASSRSRCARWAWRPSEPSTWATRRAPTWRGRSPRA